jgi:hypothetical protein
MGFDLFLDNFQNGQPAPFPNSLVKQCFGHYLSGSSGKDWSFQYPGYAEIYADEGEQISHFMVSRPPIHPEFWKGLFDLMKAASARLSWPGEGCVIADPSVRAHLPEELIEALGEPTLVTAPEQILEEIRKS